jgi:hypothetical protein
MSSKYDNLLANVPTDLWIGGKWRKASDGGRFDVLDPATDNKIASVASATVEDAKAAVDAASAGPILRVAMAAGKFQGVTSTAMPAGL